MRPEGSAEGRRSAVVLLAVVAVWGIAAAVVPLFPDEVYYWEWSRHLAAGYFDHPPVIAWLIRAGTTLFGHTPLGVRAGSLACGVLAAVATGRMAARLAGPAAGPRAILLLVILPIVTGASILATPDAPLLATTAWGLYAVLRAVEDAPGSSAAFRWWVLAGACFGLAGLSKYTAILVPLGLLAAFLARPTLRPHLASPGPWVAAILALVIVSPVVLWNAGHDWISFRFQLDHGLRAPEGGGVAGRELEYFGGQLLVATPILWAFLAAAVLRGARRADGDREVLLAAVSLVIAGLFAWSATRQRVEANWLASAYPPAVVLLAAWPLGRAGRSWLRIGGGLAIVSIGVLLLHLATPLIPLRQEPRSVSQAFGWEAVSAAAGRTAKSWQGPGRLHLAANRYQEAAALSFLMPGHPVVFGLNIASRPNQYDLWPGFAETACPGDALLLVLDGEGGEADLVLSGLRNVFSEVEEGELVERRMPSVGGAGALVSRSRLWLLKGWTGGWAAEAAPPRSDPVSSPAGAAARCRS